ncbi:unnamed protein product [Strongylus vulgaris]|uniref:7TM GPCR serpentine receptor class x (Srx) domain-containing protein n=1 Tax=Strongylus vulgaris TaxID=40348 RepID=A0A3P7IMB0_STRVU|nr:unnamed protein product [Strongylus vulgaris]
MEQNHVTIFHEHRVVGLIVFSISIIGSIGNTLVATSFRRLPSMQNSFGRMVASQSTGEAVLCYIFAFYYSPMQYRIYESCFQVFWFHTLNLLRYLYIFAFIYCIEQNVRYLYAITLRLIFQPIFHEIINCYIMGNGNYYRNCIVHISHLIFLKRHYQPNSHREQVAIKRGNVSLYGRANVTGRKLQKDCIHAELECKFIAMYIDLFKDVCIVVIIAVVDIITIFKVHLLNVHMRKTGTIDGAQRRNKEINFLKQVKKQ